MEGFKNEGKNLTEGTSIRINSGIPYENISKEDYDELETATEIYNLASETTNINIERLTGGVNLPNIILEYKKISK